MEGKQMIHSQIDFWLGVAGREDNDISACGTVFGTGNDTLQVFYKC